MKLLYLIFVMSLVLTPVSAVPTYDVGFITPDSPLWPLDLKMEELTERLMLSDDARTNLQLKHASERIAEMTLFPSERTTEEYINVIDKIESTQNLKYETAVAVQAHLEHHRQIMMSISDDSAQDQSSAIIQEISQAQSAIENKTMTMISEESAWWSEKVAEYNIISSPTPLESYGEFGKYTTRLLEGVTVIDVVRSDDTLMQSFMIRNEGNIITIQTGTTENFVKKYTFTINELKKYEVLL